ncbi:MAG: FMN-binding protein [Oscillospiraceae bacterium]|jgi:electron transport complex protein RnfG|nr:FMN-binding protein [Oscillospiraceae bacterium]
MSERETAGAPAAAEPNAGIGAAQRETGFEPFLKKHPILHMAGALLALTAFVAFLLGLIHTQTAPVIARLQAETLEAAVSGVVPGTASFQPLQADSWPKLVKSVRECRDETGALLGFAVETAPSGFGGTISLLVGVDPEGVVTGVSILDMKETPNLGTKTDDPSFLSRFVGKSVGFKLGPGAGDVQAISGATVSSTAVAGGVAAGIAAALQITQGEGTVG